MAAFSLPKINSSWPLTTTGLKASQQFIDWLAKLVTGVEAVINGQQTQIDTLNKLVAQLVATQQTVQAATNAAQQAQQTADDSGGTGGTSGTAIATVDLSGLGWVPSAQVDLTGVVAGNLTILGSGPVQLGGTVVAPIGNWSGDWRVVEIVGATETVVFSGGLFEAIRNSPADQGGNLNLIINDTDTSAFSIALVTTGAVSYRLDMQVDNGVTVTGVQGYLYARRAA